MLEIGRNESFAAFSLPGSTDHILLKGSSTHHGQFTFYVQGFDRNNSIAEIISSKEVLRNGKFYFSPYSESTERSTTKVQYLQAAKDVIGDIVQGDYEKIVISRIKRLVRESGESVFDVFEALKEAYPKAFVFIYYTPERGCWCGATPELLLKKRGAKYQTMALAGTKKLGSVSPWTDKEIHEQGVIGDFIEKVMQKENWPYHKVGPYSKNAGFVTHLCTDYSFESDELPINIARALHPGPAICGIPKDQAQIRIGEVERHDREDYCGFMAIGSKSGISDVFVNLRCMKIHRDAYELFLGGGLTAKSIPEEEWQETELKAKTLLSILEKSVVS